MELYFKTRRQWRKWLEKNHATSDGIWLIYYKKASGTTSIKYNEAVEEALCFGWIDSKLKSVNEDYYIQYFTRRRKGSVWSKYNLERVRKMIELGMMMPAGMSEYQKALDNPKVIYDNSKDEDPVIPEDLLEALNANRKAQENFMSFSKSNRRMYLFWLNSAKREPTRKTRIGKIVAFSEQNKRAGMQ